MRKASLALAVCVAASVASAPARTAVVSLRGITVIEGSRAAMVRVVVPSPARLSAARSANPTVSISGGGAFGGVAMVRENGSHWVVVGRVDPARFCVDGEPNCREAPLLVRSDRDATTASDPVLDPGEYRLYLISDGAPVSVRLNLYGLGGRARLRPRIPVRLQMREAATALSVAADQAVYSAGSVADLGPRPGLTFSTLYVLPAVHAAGRYEYCESHGGEPPGGWHPGCPGAAFSAGVDAIDVRTEPNVFEGTAIGEQSGGVVAMGWWYASAGLIPKAGQLSWWLTY